MFQATIRCGKTRSVSLLNPGTSGGSSVTISAWPRTSMPRPVWPMGLGVAAWSSTTRDTRGSAWTLRNFWLGPSSGPPMSMVPASSFSQMATGWTCGAPSGPMVPSRPSGCPARYGNWRRPVNDGELADEERYLPTQDRP